MSILVEIDNTAGNRQGNWIVRNGAGGHIISRHRLKRKALEVARREARKRDRDIRVQRSRDGKWVRP